MQHSPAEVTKCDERHHSSDEAEAPPVADCKENGCEHCNGFGWSKSGVLAIQGLHEIAP